MSAEIITGIFGAIGALLGAGGALAGTWFTTRTQRWQTVAGLSERQADARKDAYASFLTAANRFADLARDLASTLSGEAPSAEQADEIYQSYLTAWRSLTESEATVEIVGPSEVAAATNSLYSSLGGLAYVCDEWYKAVQSGKGNRRWAQFNEAKSLVDAARKDFLNAAQSTVDIA